MPVQAMSPSHASQSLKMLSPSPQTLQSLQSLQSPCQSPQNGRASLTLSLQSTIPEPNLSPSPARRSPDFSAEPTSPATRPWSLSTTPSAEPAKDAEGSEPTTTLMIRNIPKSLSQEDFVKELDVSGFAGLYDFIHMPSSGGENKGYAFVNFVSPGAAGALVGAWHRSRRWGMSATSTWLNISPAVLQGLDANVAKWRRSRAA